MRSSIGDKDGGGEAAKGGKETKEDFDMRIDLDQLDRELMESLKKEATRTESSHSSNPDLMDFQKVSHPHPQ